jgi:hypothetical protein
LLAANKALFDRLCDLGLLETMKGGPVFLGECNECQAQFINSDSDAKNDSETKIVGIRISVDGWNCSENTSLIHCGSRRPIWFEHGIEPPEESDPDSIRNVANEILGKYLEKILSMIKDGDLERHSLSAITSEYGEEAVVSCVDLDEVDTRWALQDFNFHLRFSCADFLLGVEGSIESPVAILLRELRWGAEDFSECSYFDEICSDLGMDPDAIE